MNAVIFSIVSPTRKLEIMYMSEMVLQEPEHDELEDEEDDDPVFVLTDEWREFFAKSEAKRKLAKQNAKKKDKH
ncbi:conserved hypothetical protein [Ricinus communis]|uniref:Uncharacterized protein n=1 Tax=Ricinus communis TaxID=3988 RepID=B9SYL8_RICCO|nr:conserved hypothetical protein [Ricinus communis]